ncbi:MAG: helix-turn-helix transcriptional regulator [Leptonema illini]|uniref:Helix-turn-helix transcriptional regulator n=1 Tax=Leptonema illini TaxID=183 RepID=A0A833LZR6_9LEPT|nr:MAG: helix-turn-helix transcriptional regulator [Leptonema illini]
MISWVQAWNNYQGGNVFRKMENPIAAFGDTLKAIRKGKRLSQLDLALDAGVSSRHLSFVETGRAKPSREMILRLAQTMNLSLRQQNALLVAAGFPAEFTQTPVSSPEMSMIRQALERTLSNHEPYPAFVINTSYDVLMANTGFEQFLLPLVAKRLAAEPRNILLLTFDPDGLCRYIEDWNSVGHWLLDRVWEEAISSQNDALLKLHQRISCHLPEARPSASTDSRFPVLPLTIVKDSVRIRMFSTITTLGTPLDVNLQELRIESLFPADEETAQLFLTLSGAASG